MLFGNFKFLFFIISLRFFLSKKKSLLLKPLVPEGTELDFWNGECFISVVAFQFLDSKLLGFIPAFSQRNFDEINLRFYVKRKSDDNHSRKGVVFLSLRSSSKKWFLHGICMA